ncbi:hypothetical protein AVEN_19825-1 [Araneus ventricosus]|uniref:Uncharacterized protein n=1 Tax=Araneus ventricosus TaxID=182803 RepID=A0A4Y2QBR9_ARAVE|nr:hypothetical protein AVEN_19825-1 [Araneus ventricosus]
MISIIFHDPNWICSRTYAGYFHFCNVGRRPPRVCLIPVCRPVVLLRTSNERVIFMDFVWYRRRGAASEADELHRISFLRSKLRGFSVTQRTHFRAIYHSSS